MGEFRRLFSSVINPPYCQIAMKHGVIQKWGLVEFDTNEQAEETMEKLNGHELHPGKKMRVQFCIPGVHAINVYMAFINNPMDAVTEGKGLLEDTPSTKVYDRLQSLAKHNPWFVQSLQNIMSTSLSQQQGHSKTPPQQANKTQVNPLPPPPAEADPAQAALILLLASKVTAKTNPPAQTASLLQGIVKQLETGVPAADILEQVASSEGDSSHNYNGEKSLGKIISSLVSSAQTMMNNNNNISTTQSSPLIQTNVVDAKKRDPKLMDLLYKSFQARVKNGIYTPSERNNNNNNNSSNCYTNQKARQIEKSFTSYPPPNTHNPAMPKHLSQFQAGSFQQQQQQQAHAFTPVMVPPPAVQQILPSSPSTPQMQPNNPFQVYANMLNSGSYMNSVFFPNPALPVIPPTSAAANQLLATWPQQQQQQQQHPQSQPAPSTQVQFNLSAAAAAASTLYPFQTANGLANPYQGIATHQAEVLSSEMQTQQLAALYTNPYFQMGITNPSGAMQTTNGSGVLKRKLDQAFYNFNPNNISQSTYHQSTKQMKLVNGDVKPSAVGSC